MAEPRSDLSWVREQPARWDDDKQRIIGGAPAGIFDARYADSAAGAPLPGDWWRVEQTDGQVVGYGWLDAVWGDAEILLATEVDQQGQGVGRFTLDQLAREAAERGLNYIYNVVRPTHPDARALTRWLTARGFEMQPDGRLTRRAVAAAQGPAMTPGRIGWVDLTVPAEQTAAVRDFYAAVAGWAIHPVPMDGYEDYAMGPPGGDPIAGVCHAKGPNTGLPVQWMIYIAVADLDAAMAAVEAGGGAVLDRPREGRPMAVIRDPAGSICALWGG